MNAIAHFQYFKKNQIWKFYTLQKNVYITDIIHINNIHCYILISKYLKLLYISATPQKKKINTCTKNNSVTIVRAHLSTKKKKKKS